MCYKKLQFSLFVVTNRNHYFVVCNYLCLGYKKMRKQQFITGLMIASCSVPAFSVVAGERTLNVYNWAEYMPMNVIEAFEKEYQVTVNYSTFENNEAMYTKLKLLDSAGYDVAFASTYIIAKMAREGMLAPLDKAQLSHLNDITPSLLDQPFDPNNQYSVPYVWGVTGIAYNGDYYDAQDVQSWQDLWNDKFNQQVMLLDDVRDVFGMALKSLGYSINTTNEQEVKQAYQRLRALKPNIVVYNSDAPHVPFVTGEVAAGMQWNGNAYLAREELPELGFVYPQEGAIMWMDNFVIPSGSENQLLAHQFINFILRPENQAQIVKTLGYPAPSQAAKQHLPEKMQNDPLIFPDDALIANGEFTDDIGSFAEIYQKYWQKLKS